MRSGRQIGIDQRRSQREVRSCVGLRPVEGTVEVDIVLIHPAPCTPRVDRWIIEDGGVRAGCHGGGAHPRPTTRLTSTSSTAAMPELMTGKPARRRAADQRNIGGNDLAIGSGTDAMRHTARPRERRPFQKFGASSDSLVASRPIGRTTFGLGCGRDWLCLVASSIGATSSGPDAGGRAADQPARRRRIEAVEDSRRSALNDLQRRCRRSPRGS